MSSKPQSPIQDHEQLPVPAPSSPFHEVPLDVALKTHGNETLHLLQTPPRESVRAPLSPADCRTLEKILEDTRSPSPLASHARDESLLSVESFQDGSSDTGVEDTVQYTDRQHDHGDESDDGYEDEDDSMDLSDTVDEGFHDGDDVDNEDHGEGPSTLSVDEEPEYEWSDGDTIEDIMNMPGKTAPPARQQDLGGMYTHDQPTSDKTKEIKLKRASLERALVRERVNQERRAAMSAGSDGVHFDATSLEDQDIAVNLSDDPEIQAVQDLQINQSRADMSALEEDIDRGVELEYIAPVDRRTTRLFSPTPASRRALTDSPDSLSFVASPDTRPAVMSTPSGRHLEFTRYATIPDTSFTKTFSYSNHYRGKENSPTKNRRNASLPEEIAELAREAKEEEDLDAYREMDLAPMEPVMESQTAGDLITFGTPKKSNISTAAIGPTTPDVFAQRTSLTRRLSLGLGENLGTFKIEENSNAEVHQNRRESQSQSIWSPVQQDDVKAEIDIPDAVLDEESLGDEHKQMILYPQHPTFVTVIGMLPQAMFWATAAPIAKYSGKAYEALVEKLSELKF